MSQYLLKKAEEFGYQNRNGAVIYNGYNANIFYPVSFRTIPRYMGFVGHTSDIKRADILPDVLDKVRKVFPDTRLLVLGSEEPRYDLRPRMKLRLNELGIEECVDFVSSVAPDKVGDYIRTLDVLLFPSRCEGFGCVAIEAQACGVAVVAADTGGISEAVGDGGVLVPESDHFTDDFAQAVIDYFQHPMPKDVLLERAKNFTWEKTASSEAAIYKEIAAVHDNLTQGSSIR